MAAAGTMKRGRGDGPPNAAVELRVGHLTLSRPSAKG